MLRDKGYEKLTVRLIDSFPWTEVTGKGNLLTGARSLPRL